MKNLKRVSKSRSTHSATKGNPGEFDDQGTGELAIKKTVRTQIIPGGGPSGKAVRVPDNVPETPLPLALQSPGIKTMEDARGRDAATRDAQIQRSGDGSGHWSGH